MGLKCESLRRLGFNNFKDLVISKRESLRRKRESLRQKSRQVFENTGDYQLLILDSYTLNKRVLIGPVESVENMEQ